MSARVLELELTADGKTRSARVGVNCAVIAGWTGRDARQVEKHIAELEAIGVKRPDSVPIFYRVAAARLSSAAGIEVTGTESSGEVEFVLLQHEGRLWIGAGSDHTDRKVETYNISVSKQMCEKPISREWWAFEDVAPHWDQLQLRSYVGDADSRVLYQQGSVATMLEPADLVTRYAGKPTLPEGTVMFCGTLAAIGGLRPAASFHFELEDPVRRRTIRHSYQIHTLPLLG